MLKHCTKCPDSSFSGQSSIRRFANFAKPQGYDTKSRWSWFSLGSFLWRIFKKTHILRPPPKKNPHKNESLVRPYIWRHVFWGDSSNASSNSIHGFHRSKKITHNIDALSKVCKKSFTFPCTTKKPFHNGTMGRTVYLPWMIDFYGKRDVKTKYIYIYNILPVPWILWAYSGLQACRLFGVFLYLSNQSMHPS